MLAVLLFLNWEGADIPPQIRPGKFLGSRYENICILFVIAIRKVSTSSCFCGLLITFTNSLEPDQGRQNISLDLNPNHLALYS